MPHDGMSGCPGFSDMNALLDGEVPGENELAVRRHLAVCASCRRRLDGLTALTRAVARAYDGAVPPPALSRAILAGVSKR